MDKINFNAGPSVLPSEIFPEMAEAVINYKDTGLSLLEISHRSSTFMDIIEEAQQLVRSLLRLPDHFEVLFLTGGSTTQFALVPYNLLPVDGVAGYLDTGTWSTKAINAAKKFGEVDVCGSSESDQYRFIPKDYKIDPEWSYLYLTSNNTIYGTQLHQLPETNGIPLVVDMCSDIFSKPIKDIDRYGLIHASAQKNLGPSGTTLVLVNKNLLGKTGRDIPMVFDYLAHIKKKSVLNTPAVYAIYGCLLTLRWIKNRGLNRIAKENEKKASLLYAELDNNPLFVPKVRNAEDRSIMNATFDLTKAGHEKTFDVFCENHGIVGIKGHRSVGGFRASMYNAMPVETIEGFVKLMQDFAWRFG